jgi:AraC family transcriptional activator FtrA
LDAKWYDLRSARSSGGPIRGAGGIFVQACHGLRSLERAGPIVIPGWKFDGGPAPRQLLRALRSAHARDARLVSICSGVFRSAETGLLESKRFTAHWRLVDRFRARFPEVRLEPDLVYVDEGDMLTSAGSAAGLDRCSYIVRRYYRAEIANRLTAGNSSSPPKADRHHLSTI